MRTFTSSLNSQQQSAVESDERLICMMAGPGSGKTHTLIERTRRLIEDGNDPAMMAVITFTNEAARELERRSEHAFGYCGTLHGFMLRLLQQHGSLIGLGEKLTILDEAARDALLKEVCKESGYRGTKGELQAALDLGPHWLENSKGAGNALSKAQTAALLYYQRLCAGSMADYDSILHFGLRLARALDPWDLKFLYLFVDEYQDSSPLDAQIYDALPVSDRFYIGDPDQSIYAFRGASVENILQLAERPDAQVLALEDNYRSGARICAVAQCLIEHNAARPAKRTRSARDIDSSITLERFIEEREELVWIARQINALPDAGECAVLVRTNKLVEYFRDGLAGFGVPMPRVKRAATPADWSKAQLLLSLLCNPDNDRLAYAWLLETKGQAAADNAKLEALSNFDSINATALHLKTPELHVVPLHLGLELISPESFERVKAAVETLPGGATLPELVASLQHEPAVEYEGGGVHVSTIHGAKGREWDHVFLPAFEQGVLPSQSKSASIEEERRLAFVAMTRARHSLNITHSQTRREFYKFGERLMEPSQFIAEIEGEF